MCCPSRRDRRPGLRSRVRRVAPACAAARVVVLPCWLQPQGAHSQAAQQCLWETVGRQAPTNRPCHRSNRGRAFSLKISVSTYLLVLQEASHHIQVKIHIFQNDTKALLSLASSPAQPSTNGSVRRPALYWPSPLPGIPTPACPLPADPLRPCHHLCEVCLSSHLDMVISPGLGDS